MLDYTDAKGEHYPRTLDVQATYTAGMALSPQERSGRSQTELVKPGTLGKVNSRVVK
jgi:hypothetical protein